MNAIVIAAAVMASTGLNTGYITGKQYVVALTICQGDPLGKAEAGAVEVLSRPILCLTQGQTGFFQVGQLAPVSQQQLGHILRARVVPQSNTTVQLQLEYHHRELISQIEHCETTRDAASRQSPVLVLGKPTTLRLAAESATKQTWATVTVYEDRANPPVTMRKGMTWTVRGLGSAGK
jgi:hypothetical protein